METELCNMCMITDAEGRVLVQERLPKPSNPWSGLTFPGGHVEPGETVVASVIREVQEETGLTVSNLQNCGYIQWYNPIKQSQYFVFLFKTSTFSGELTGSVEGNVKWMTLEEMLAGNLAPNMTKYLAVFQNETIPQAYGISGQDPRFDKVGITTLFTFYWDITIDTINFAKNLCKKTDDVMVGGIMSSLLPNEVYAATGIKPFVGLLNHPGDIDPGNELIIDELPLDYSILEEIDYVYPANNAYFAYMTRGCVNKCKFCAVPKLEPEYCDYINLKTRIEVTDRLFGARKDLLLLDNNVLASSCYDKIIDEIKECGFGVG